jgi:hypothetical protein
VDGSELARAFFTFAALVGAGMQSVIIGIQASSCRCIARTLGFRCGLRCPFYRLGLGFLGCRCGFASFANAMAR